ncbi:NAD(P)-binding protein [Mucilaginibacter sp. HC2]|uniref:FAD-dependent oxidoreductase n=1 Tax=Mucilaginibacter inviolabilis TaxID=2714892 RepID=UPI001409C23C|nr:FAD-dependent monooxygenase [Mucilaginibacter inviolabilis]NHA06149.1 NAD(P)-binding protein [Mucilaginibacter inviolabilis]
MNITTIYKKEPLQVAIIGAGLGGLCLAQGLKKNGIAFQVFEKDSAANSRTQGYRIRIDKTGQDALAACLSERLYTLFSETVVPSVGVRTLNAQLELLTDKWVDSWEDGEANAQPDLKANRLTMREILLLGLNKQVHFNKKFVSYEKQPDDRVCVHFEDGTSFTADVLVAADGVNSRLGAQRFPAQELVDTGSVCVYGKTFYTEQAKKQVDPALQTDTAVIFENELAMIADAMQFKSTFVKAGEQYGPDAELTYTEDYMYWALIGNRGRFGLNNEQALTFASGELFDCLKQVTSAWAPTLKALFESANPESLTIVPVKTSLPQDAWSSDNITALGDSIHAMSPAGGLGANTALYDAALLTACLTKVAAGETALLDAIAQYEEKMREHSCNSINASQRGGKKLYKQSAD